MKVFREACTTRFFIVKKKPQKVKCTDEEALHKEINKRFIYVDYGAAVQGSMEIWQHWTELGG